MTRPLFADQPSFFSDAIGSPMKLETMGDLGAWLDAKPTPALFAYLFHGSGEVERIACFMALVRREVRHQLRYHPPTLAERTGEAPSPLDGLSSPGRD
jgi:hypothetical protein